MQTLLMPFRFLYLYVVIVGAVFKDCVQNPKWLLSLLSEALLEILHAVPAILAYLAAAIIAVVVSVIRRSCDDKGWQKSLEHSATSLEAYTLSCQHCYVAPSEGPILNQMQGRVKGKEAQRTQYRQETLHKQAEDTHAAFLQETSKASYVPSMPWWDSATADALDGQADCDPSQMEATPAQEPLVHEQAVYVPSMPRWEPARADALDDDAPCDPPVLEAAPAQKPLVHKQAEPAAGTRVAASTAEHDLANQMHTKAVNFHMTSRLSGASDVHAPVSPFSHGDTRPQVLDSDDSSSSDGSPLASPATVQELRRQLAEAKQQASNDLASAERCAETKLAEAKEQASSDRAQAERRAAKDLAVAQAAAEKLQKLCNKLEAENTELHRSLNIPCMSWGPEWQRGHEIGHGQNGVVFSAVSRDTPGTVLKQAEASFLQREADTLWSLHHPNIVRGHAFLTTQEKDEWQHNLAYLALDRLGPSLSSYTASHSRMTTRQVVVGFQGLFAGVAYMHSKGIVDQDLHTGNILLSLDGSTLIKADLGAAVPAEVDGRPNWLGRIMCCAGTESPQAAKSFLNEDWYRPLFGSDVWALGLVMLQVVGGQKPEQHKDILSSKQYLGELNEDDLDASDPDDAPGKYRHLKYLSDLLADPATPDYSDQVTFPSWLCGHPNSAEAQLKWIIQSCLHVRLRDRWQSDQVHVALHQIMMQYGWCNNMLGH